MKLKNVKNLAQQMRFFMLIRNLLAQRYRFSSECQNKLRCYSLVIDKFSFLVNFLKNFKGLENSFFLMEKISIKF